MKREIHEFPRPDFRRGAFQLLDGTFDFCFDDENVGLSEQWYNNPVFDQKIEVPFCYQCEASTIGTTAYHPIVWYAKRFSLDEILTGSTTLLHFGAVDYRTTVWINGLQIGTHEGGYTPFHFDISTALAQEEEHLLVVRVEDYFDCTQPRGKQYWKEYNEMCWYQGSTGIWQSVWLESAQGAWLTHLGCTPDIDTSTVTVAYEIEGPRTLTRGTRYTLSFALRHEHLVRDPSSYSMDPSYKVNQGERPEYFTTITVDEIQGRLTLAVPIPDKIKNTHWWSPETPNLIGLTVTLLDGDEPVDSVDTYFGMRKVEIKNGEVLLNHQPLTQTLVLDQGYWDDTFLTPPSSLALRKDIELAIKMGFNGARKHQKIEHPHFYYWADVLGFLVWGELPSAYHFSDTSMQALRRDMQAFIRRDYNHPSIITWVPLNESWGVRDIVIDTRQQAFAASLYWMIKGLDPTRLVIANDGWEMVNESDFYGIHDYSPTKESLNPAYFISAEAVMRTAVQKKRLLVDGIEVQEKPLLITEYGGIAFEDKSQESWGYFGKVGSEEEFLARFEAITEAFTSLPYCIGVCYTQLTDVFQEKNGLLDMKRNPKIALTKIRAILTKQDVSDRKPTIVV